jgi:hypothetical protein
MTRAIGACRRRSLVPAADGALELRDEAAVHSFEPFARPAAVLFIPRLGIADCRYVA